MARSSFGTDFKTFFGKGLGILLPTILTLWILVQLGVFLYNNVGEPINRGLRTAVIEVTPRVLPDESLPSWFRVSEEEVAAERGRILAERPSAEPVDDQLRREIRRDKFKEFWAEHWYLDLSGLMVAIVLVYFAGMLLGGYIGRRLYARLEDLLKRLPGFKQVYPHVKQVTEMVLGDSAMAFSRVVLVQYPREGIWTVGLVTGHSLQTVSKASGGGDVLTVFIPSTPTPFTGFTINLRAEEVIDVPMQVEEAIRYFITGGVLVPEQEARDAKQISGTGSGGSTPDPEKVAQQMRAGSPYESESSGEKADAGTARRIDSAGQGPESAA